MRRFVFDAGHNRVIMAAQQAATRCIRLHLPSPAPCSVLFSRPQARTSPEGKRLARHYREFPPFLTKGVTQKWMNRNEMALTRFALIRLPGWTVWTPGRKSPYF